MSKKKGRSFLPPKVAHHFLRWYCHPDLYQEISGDLFELHQRRGQEMPLWKANSLYWLNILLFCRPWAWRKRKNFLTQTLSIMILLNYFTTFRRVVSKSPLYSGLNLVGLIIGFTVVLAISSFLQVQTSFDRFHPNYQRVFRVTEMIRESGGEIHSAMAHAPIADILSTQWPQTEQTVRILRQPMIVTIEGEDKVKEDQFCYADSNFFEVFHFETISGDINKALNAPHSLVLTQRKAMQYFGSIEVVGKTLIIENDRKEFEFVVTAVIDDLPQHTHFRFDMLASFSTVEKNMPWYNNWHHPPVYVYLKTESLENPIELNTQINRHIRQHQPDYVKEENREYLAQPIADIHLHSQLQDEWKANFSYKYVQIFGMTAILILVVACLNYINLSTARAARRAREVGVRKVMGAKKHHLIFQFLAESLFMVLIAFATSWGLTYLVFFYFFNDFIQLSLNLNFLLSATYLPWLITALIVLVVLSGLYPALQLAQFKPTHVLKKQLGKEPRRAKLLRGSLVTFQFVVSSFLLIGTLVTVYQFWYMRNKSLGFQKDAMVAIYMVDKYSSGNYQVLKDRISKLAGVNAIAVSSSVPGKSDFFTFDVKPEGVWEEKGITVKTLGLDEDFLETYQMEVLHGRNFSVDRLTDQKDAFIVNESALKLFGWEGNPIGKEFSLTVYTGKEEVRKGEIIGVVKDFHFQSLHSEIEPLVLYINKHLYYTDYLTIRIEPSYLEDVVTALAEEWNMFNPHKPMDWFFLDDFLEDKYRVEQKTGQVFTLFSSLSLLIACLGIVGLASSTLRERKKEVSIRKVFGANLSTLFSLLTKEFFLIVVIANAIAIPLCAYLSDQWLQSYPYRVELQFWVFLTPLLATMLIMFSGIIFQTLQAALSNPINALREE